MNQHEVTTASHPHASAGPGGGGFLSRNAVFALALTAVSTFVSTLLPPEGLLWAMVVLPGLFAFGLVCRPAGLAKWWGLGGTFVNLFVCALLMGRFVWSSAAFQAQSSIEWLPGLGLNLSVGVDSVAMLLIALTALLGPVCVLASWTAIRERQRLFYGWLLLLQCAMVGVFAARDLVFFYICFEFTLLPMFVLINEFGSTNRKKAAVKFFLYTFTGSLIALAGLVYTAVAVSRASGVDGFSLDIGTLTQHAATMMTSGEQTLVLLAMLAGFAVKVPLFPVHTWLPLAHTEAPTAGSVVLAGVLLKLGTYAMYRLVLPLVPLGAYENAPWIGVLCIIGILYAGLICWVQTDVKKLVAYSSVSHLGFCVLGLFAMNPAGLTGSVLYMINHGLSTGALFLLIGFMYERYHTRDMRRVGGLAAKMPAWSFFMVFFAMASVGLPGLNGFVSEFFCIMGAFQSDTDAATGLDRQLGATFGPLGPWFGVIAGVGVIVAAIYLLHMVACMVWGSLKEPAEHGLHHHDHHDHADAGAHGPTLPTDLNAREIFTLAPLAALCLALGLFPAPLLKALKPAVTEQVAALESGVRLGGGAGGVQRADAATNTDLQPRSLP